MTVNIRILTLRKFSILQQNVGSDHVPINYGPGTY